MLYRVYAIYDSGISSWLKPIYSKNNGEILRSFAEACNEPSSHFAKHPGDYTLFELGSFDDDSCKFDLLPTPVRLVMAQELIKSAGAGGNTPSSGL